MLSIRLPAVRCGSFHKEIANKKFLASARSSFESTVIPKHDRELSFRFGPTVFPIGESDLLVYLRSMFGIVAKFCGP